MRIIEVRDNYIKIEALERLPISSFIQICDETKSYVAQIVKSQSVGEYIIAHAKILYLFNGNLYNYDKSLPSINSEVKKLDFSVISKHFETKNKILIGNFIDNNENIYIDKGTLNKKTLISINNFNEGIKIISNMEKQCPKSLIIDMQGCYNSSKYIAGVDFKLPLNKESLQFLFEDCLNDATSDSKNLIKDIFKDIADYSETVSFVPFETLKTIVDDMVDKQHVFKLLVLKNKLSKFSQLGYFATTQEEVKNLNNILESKNAIIDLSKLDSIFQNRYMSIIFSIIEKQKYDMQVFVISSNNINKSTLKRTIYGDIPVALIVQDRFKYINEIKSMLHNFIIEPSFANNQNFKEFSSYLNSLNGDNYLIVNETYEFIPLVSTTIELTDIPEIETVEENEVLNELDSQSAVNVSDDNNIELNGSEDDSLEIIAKQSENLINRISDEIQEERSTENFNIFAEEDLEEDSEDESILEELAENKNDVIEEDNPVQENLEEQSLDNITSEINISEEDLGQETEAEFVESDEINEAELEIKETEEYHTQIDEVQSIEIPQDLSMLNENSSEFSEIIEELQEDAIEESEIIIEQDASLSELDNEQLSDNLDNDSNLAFETFTEDITDNIDEIVEIDDLNSADADIVVEMEDDEAFMADDIDKAIVEDVDKVFTTIKDDSISDTDLDFIDELNNDSDEQSEEIVLSEGMEELTAYEEFEAASELEDTLLEPIEEFNSVQKDNEKEILAKKSATTPIVPVYGAEIPSEDIVMSDAIEQGDSVSHAKYGNGVVEKMIKYGAKTLYSINFDNVGRRLLDPTLTEIKKI